MYSYEKQLRDFERARKRHEREELRVAREIARQRKLQAKADELDQARFEAEEYRAQLAVVLSLHREVGELWDWHEVACTLPPHAPSAAKRHERRMTQDLAIAANEQQQRAESLLENARRSDKLEFEAEVANHNKERTEWEKMTALARRILAGDTMAYLDAITEFSPLLELSDLGSEINFKVHTPAFIECQLKMKDGSVVPSEIKTLTSSGKLSVRAMPRQQSHEIYQDYICGGILRVAREVFALLPVEEILATVLTTVESASGSSSVQPVLSVII